MKRNSFGGNLNILFHLFIFSIIFILIICLPISLRAQDNTIEEIPGKFNDFWAFSEGLAPVKKDGKWGFIDRNGNFIIQPELEWVWYFSEGLAPANQNKKRGFIDKTGKFVIPAKFDGSRNFSDGLASIKVNGFFGFIDKEGNLIIKPEYTNTGDFSEDLASVKFNGLWGYIDKKNNFVIPPQYSEASKFVEGKAPVMKGGKWGYINKKGKFEIEPIYEYAKPFSEGLAPVRQNGRYGYIDVKGNFVIPAQYENAEEFKEGFGLVKLNDKWGYIDKSGLILIPIQYDYALTFSEGIAPVRENGENKFLKLINSKESLPIYVPQPKDDQLMAQQQNQKSLEAQRLEQERIEKERLEAQRLEQERIEKERLEAQRLEQERIEKERLEAQRLEQERIEKERLEAQRLEQERIEKERLEAQRLEQERIEKERLEAQRLEQKRKEQERMEAQRLEQERIEKERLEALLLEMEPDNVDKDIPVSIVGSNRETFAVIIGNEDYQRVSKVPFAEKDATVFAEYCEKTLGLPKKNIRMHNNATFAQILMAIKDIQDISKAYKGELDVIFYYAGHGIPDEKTLEAFLLPIDADGRQTEVCYPLERLYAELGTMNARSVTIFMDACFSGSDRGNNMLIAARGVALKHQKTNPVGNMVVFSAALGDETAYPFEEGGHGLFTYFLLKKLKQSKGDISLGDLGEYIIENVTKESIVSFGKSQTPTINVSSDVLNKWESRKLNSSVRRK